jgi:YHS domain-containing protein
MRLIFLNLLVLFSFTAEAQSVSYCSKDGNAIKGYDPVAYFLDGKAIQGDESFSYEWSGSRWLFTTQAHLDSFKLAPRKYAPQYGGYCAYGVSENHKSPTDPQAWTIIDNKLYLNYSPKVKNLWLKDTTGRIQQANNYWPSLQ